MQIVEDKALLLNTRFPHELTGLILNSRVIESNDKGSTVAVKWALPEARALAKLKYDPPSPILRDYNWPGPFPPFDHQKTTASFLSVHDKAFCFNEAGTSKTASALWAVDYLMQCKEVKRVLVLCPLSIMQMVWQKEIAQFTPHLSCAVAHGTPKKREAAINSGADFVVINFDGLATVKDTVMKGGFDLVIVDEASAYNNAQTARWKTLRDVVAHVKRLWMMTGTPAAQSPAHAFGLAKLVNDDCPRYYTEFRDQVMYKVTQFQWRPRPGSAQAVHKVLQPAIRFERSQCLDLPPVLFSNREAPLTKMQHDYYSLLVSTLRFEASGEVVTTVNAAANMIRLLQIAGGTVRTDSGNILEFDVSNRINVVLEAIQEASHKTLIFVPFTAAIDLLHDALLKHGVSCEIIDGRVSMSKRGATIRAFQERPNPRVLLLQPEAAAHGLTLTEANTVIWYSPVTRVETYLQGNARVDRPGQVNNVNVIHICGSPVERKLYALLQSNLLNHEKLIELYRQVLNDEA